MAVRPIMLYPSDEASLRRKSKPVKSVSLPIQNLIQDLKETLAQTDSGIGLAAPQINAHKRVVIVRLGSGQEEGAEPAPPIALINPVIKQAGNARPDFDGCLSFPGLYGETSRPHHLRVMGLDEEGKPFDRVFENMDAVLVHHEIDHLDGTLFIDRVKSIEDLYQVGTNEDGQFVRMPLAPGTDIKALLSNTSPR